MSKQDMNAVRTAQDLEIKYDLGSIAGLKKNYEIQKQGLTKVENELNDFVKVATKDIEEIKNQVDGNITTWFSSGIPTLENYPTNEWITDVDKSNHLGDLYYDNDTGKGYRFTKQDDDYLWYEIIDTDTTEALALASKAQDTADSKRRVFLITPYVPYDEGDLWLNNQELYVCTKSKVAEETYTASDFEKATKYTDDSALNNFISGEYADDIELINTQIDKKAETWHQSSDPSIVWTTEILKKNHVGDIWYNTAQNKNYIYTSDYNWEEVDGVPDSVYDKIDGKAQIFTSQPTPPYYKGDLFTEGNAGDILVCITERLTGDYNANDWEKAGKYTDDTNLNNFVNVTYTEAMKNLTNQIDSKITTWYYSGEPTLDNEPAGNWNDEDKLKHTGDLYYDQNTGYSYRFSLENDIYSWKKITDKDVVESLAIANSAKDTADRKRQVFVAEPIPPYDVGDLWIKDEEIYRCQTSRPKGEIFEDNDWIKATKYTDDTVANQVDGKLTILSGTVTEINQDVDKLNTAMTNTTKLVDEHGNTIGILQEKQSETTQTVNGISTKVSSVENSLAATNSNLSNLSNTVDTLNDDIDGVSADFEDFKDNEYIQSIDNLQKQIDGAIQFWNGAEIPTINNYPANQWTTENDKINHQADIYTVIEDIDGEMKQGKSYRFDKVNGVWRWIELTDNELSAVQAIAQDALNKANANATELGTVKTRVSSLEQTDDQIKASVESIDKQIIPTATVTGSNIYVEDASNNPLIDFEIEGKSTQKTRSGKNLIHLNDTTTWKGVTIQNNNDGTITLNGTAESAIDFWFANGESYLATDYKYVFTTGAKLTQRINQISGAYTGSYILRTIIYDTDNSEANWGLLVGDKTYTATFNGETRGIELYIASGTVFDNLVLFPQLEVGENATNPEQYGVSPSPDYPSEIESVGYENLIDISTLQKGYVASNGGITIPGAGWYYYERYSNFIKVKPNTAYFFKIVETSNTADNWIGVGEYTTDDFNSFIKRDVMSTVTQNYIKFTTTATTEYIVVSARNLADATKILLIEGDTEKPYIPNGKYGIEVETVGENLFDEKQLLQATNWTLNENGYYNGTFLNFHNSFGTIANGFTFDKVFKENTRYTLSFNAYVSSGVASIRFYYTDGTYQNLTLSNTSDTFSTITSQANKTLSKILGTYQSGGTNILYIKNIQVEEGDIPTEYKPYQSNSLLIILNEPLRSLPNGIKDLLYIKNNKLYVDRYIGSLILDGSESWGVSNTDGQSTARFTLSNTTFRNYSSGYCNTNKYATSGLSSDIHIVGKINNLIYYRINKTIAESIAQFKTWLSTHNTELCCELAEPYTEELGEIEIPSTFKGVNNITTTDKLEPTINIEYVRDTTLSNYVENQINKVMAIEERHHSELVVEDDSIKASVTEINSNLSEMTEDIHTVQETLTSAEKTIEVIFTNIDRTTGEIRELTTINGYKFNKDGLNIYTNENSFNTLIDNEGTYYKDGDTIISETTKDGFMATNIKNKGGQEYCYDDSNKVYEFVKERIEVDGEYGYATFYNGVN